MWLEGQCHGLCSSNSVINVLYRIEDMLDFTAGFVSALNEFSNIDAKSSARCVRVLLMSMDRAWIEPRYYMTLCAKDTEAYMYRCIVRSKGLAGIEDKEDFEKLEKKRPIPTT